MIAAPSTTSQRAPRRVLLVFPGALGDLLLLWPAATALARAGARVEFSVQRALAALVRPTFSTGPAADGAAVGTLFGRALDPALATWLRDADVVHLWLGPSARDALARRARALGLARVVAQRVVRTDGATHASAAYARALGVRGALAPPRLALEATEPSTWWRAPRAARLLVHPGAGAAGKRWSADGFRRVAERWRKRGGEVTVLLGPAEEGDAPWWRATGERIASGLDLVEAARLLAGAGRYVGNDSGISHLAGALDLAGAVLFGPTRPARWRPLGGALTPVGFGPARSVASVATAVLRLLARRGGPSAGSPTPTGESHLDTPTSEH